MKLPNSKEQEYLEGLHHFRNKIDLELALGKVYIMNREGFKKLISPKLLIAIEFNDAHFEDSIAELIEFIVDGYVGFTSTNVLKKKVATIKNGVISYGAKSNATYLEFYALIVLTKSV
jgi:hypothetical protein